MTMHPEINISMVADDFLLFAKIAHEMKNNDPWKQLGMDERQCLLSFEGPCKEIHVATVRNEFAGLVIIQTGGSFKGYIQTLFVTKLYQSKGIGSALLAYAEQRILKLSPNVFICVSAFNDRARRLYLSKGYKQIAVLHDFIKEGFDELLLRKTVGPIIDYSIQSV